jgi:hypothetical protein
MTADTEAARVAAIAAKLTEAQRETMLDGRRCVRSYKPAQKLVELGIWDGDGDEYTIYPSWTDFGLRVRQHLQEQTDAL